MHPETSQHPNSVRDRFNAAAATYERHAHVQDRVAERVIERLADEPDPETVLDAGCGSGILTRKLLQRFPRAHIDALDLSGRMIEEARRRCPEEGRIRWRVDHMETLNAEKPYDLVASSSSLHWADPLSEAIRNVKGCLAPDGVFVVAIMLKGTLRELRRARREAAPHKMPVGRLPGFQEMVRLLQQTGFASIDAREETFRADYASARDFLRSIHEQGLTGGSISHGKQPLTRGELARLADAYDAEYALEHGGVYATYHVGYFKARADRCDQPANSTDVDAA